MIGKNDGLVPGLQFELWSWSFLSNRGGCCCFFGHLTSTYYFPLFSNAEAVNCSSCLHFFKFVCSSFEYHLSASLSGVPLVSVIVGVLEPDIPQLRSLHSALENIRARLMITAGMLTKLSGFFKLNFNFCTIEILVRWQSVRECCNSLLSQAQSSKPAEST